MIVATALTACGIETTSNCISWYPIRTGCNGAYRLRYWNTYIHFKAEHVFKLQRRLPLAVLKLCGRYHICLPTLASCNGAYRLRYWNLLKEISLMPSKMGCNGAYRLRYWNRFATYNYRRRTEVATALTACGIETKVSSPKLVITSNCCNGAYRLRYWNP